MRTAPLAGLVLLVAMWAGNLLCTASPPTGKTGYAGPMFDAMAQIESGQSGLVLDGMEASGVTRMALFARLKPRRSGESDVLALLKRYPERFVVGTPKRFDLRDDLPDSFVSTTLEQLQREPYRFVGEILFVHADKSNGEETATGERYLAADGKNLFKLLAALEKRRVPVMTHWEVYNWPRDWPKFDALYAHFPNLIFIWPHAGFGSVGQVEAVLSSHRNVVITLSKTESDQRHLSSDEKKEMLGSAFVDSTGTLRPEWKSLLEKYPERFLFATDAHKGFRWREYEHIVRQWRSILGQLSEPLARKIAWQNAERVFAPQPSTREVSP